MQDLLVNPRIKDKIITLKDYEKLSKPFEFILYGDNILEGISLLNNLTLNDDLLAFYGVVYEPYDSPIYIFRESNHFYAIKICGHYDKWNLPNDVSFIKSFVDLPDYIFYSIQHSKVILAGEIPKRLQLVIHSGRERVEKLQQQSLESLLFIKHFIAEKMNL